MAISKQVENNNLLNAWAKVMNEYAFTFNQVQGKGAPLNDKCGVYIQPEREDVARALDSAIKKMARTMRFWPRPKWFQDTIQLGLGVPIRNQLWRTQKSAKVIAFGSRGSALIDDDVPVVYSDPNNLGINTLATITVTTTVTDPDEIQLFFRTADGAPGAADTRYQIEPVMVSIDTGLGQATITADRAMFVKPAKIWDVPYELTDPNMRERNAGDTEDAGDFVEMVDVYRIYNDTTSQVEILDMDNTVQATHDGVIVDADTGIFGLSSGCIQYLSSCRVPVRVRVNYLAGESLVFGAMDPELEEAIIRLANVLMPEALCPFCERASDRFQNDRSPMVQENVAILTANDVQNEFGSVLRGAVYAYKIATDRAIVVGGKLTRGWR